MVALMKCYTQSQPEAQQTAEARRVGLQQEHPGRRLYPMQGERAEQEHGMKPRRASLAPLSRSDPRKEGCAGRFYHVVIAQHWSDTVRVVSLASENRVALIIEH